MPFLVETTVGPLPTGLGAVLIPGVRILTRPARPGEVSSTVRCPRCRGRNQRRDQSSGSNCTRCGGTGFVQGVPLARLQAPAGSEVTRTFLSWARTNRLRSDVRLVGAYEEGPDWNMAWMSPGRTAEVPGERCVGHRLIGVFAAIGPNPDGHVALHRVLSDGTAEISGLWNVDAGTGTPKVSWSSRRASGRARSLGLEFPRHLVSRQLGRLRSEDVVAVPAAPAHCERHSCLEARP